jgi:hypothetical protein
MKASRAAASLPSAGSAAQHAIAAILAKAFDQRGPSSARTTSPMRDRLRRAGQRKAAADAALGRDEAAVGEVAHHLGQMVAGNAELGRDLVGRERAAGSPASRIRARKAKSVNDVRRMGVLSKVCLQIIYSRLNRYLKYLFKAARNGSDRDRAGAA